MVLVLLLLVPITALALVLGMSRLEDALLTAPAEVEDEPAAPVAAAPVVPAPVAAAVVAAAPVAAAPALVGSGAVA